MNYKMGIYNNLLLAVIIWRGIQIVLNIINIVLNMIFLTIIVYEPVEFILKIC